MRCPATYNRPFNCRARLNNLQIIFATKAALRFGEQRRMATALWSCQSVLRGDEIWLPEWSGNLGGV
jgi:hypothetical protein